MPTMKLLITLPFILSTSIASAFTEDCPPIKPDCDAIYKSFTLTNEKQTEFVFKIIK